MTYEAALLEVRHRKNFYFDNNTIKTFYTERERDYFDTVISALEKCVALDNLNKERIKE